MQHRITITFVGVCALLAGIVIGYQWSPKLTRPMPNEAFASADHRTGSVPPAATSPPVADTDSQPLSFEQFRAAFDKLLRERSPGRREAAHYRLVHGLASSQISQALAFLAKRRESEAASLGLELLDRWAQDDPVAAMTYANSLRHAPQRAKATAMVLEEWAASNPVGAINWLSTLPPTKDKDQWLNTTFAYIGFWDPTNALAMSTSLDVSQALKGRLRATILARWAERDGPGAAAALSNMSGLPPTVYGDVASAWAAQDPKLAVAWAASLPSAQARNMATRRAAEAWAGIDGQAAADYFLSQSTNTQQSAILSSLFSRWASEDPSAVMSWVANLSDAAAKTRLLPGLASACAKVDPLSASPYLQSLPANMQEDVARRIAGALFEQDPQQGADFVASLPAGEIQSTAQKSLARKWASQDLSGALAWLGELPQGAGRDAALDGLLPEWTRNDPGAAAAYVQALPLVSQAPFLSQIAKSWATENPAAAAAWVATLPQGEGHDLIAAQVAGIWVDSSPRDAANYVASLPPGQAQEIALTPVLMGWMSSDPDDVRQWLEQFPASKMRDQAVGYVAQYLGNSDVASATTWLDKNFDGAYRKQEEDLARQWLLLDQAGARKWILNNSSLPTASKQRLLNPVPGQ
jgi:hypothetical protein